MTDITKTANEYFLTQAQFNTRKQAGTLEVGAVYHITDANAVEAPDTPATQWSVLCYSGSTHKNTWYQMQEGAVALSIPYRNSNGSFLVETPLYNWDPKSVANKRYVDDKAHMYLHRVTFPEDPQAVYAGDEVYIEHPKSTSLTIDEIKSYFQNPRWMILQDNAFRGMPTLCGHIEVNPPMQGSPWSITVVYANAGSYPGTSAGLVGDFIWNTISVQDGQESGLIWDTVIRQLW